MGCANRSWGPVATAQLAFGEWILGGLGPVGGVQVEFRAEVEAIIPRSIVDPVRVFWRNRIESSFFAALLSLVVAKLLWCISQELCTLSNMCKKIHSIENT